MLDYVVFDLETTGWSAQANEIIEIGAWKIINGVAREKFSSLVKPVMYIPQLITNVNGITNEMVKDCEGIEAVLPEFFDFCGDYPFLAHNLKFDYEFVEVKGKKLGLDFTLKGMRQGICTLKLAKKLYPSTSHKLTDLTEHLGVSLQGNAHRADYDAYLTKLIYDRFLDSFKGKLDVEMPEMLVDNKCYGQPKNKDVLSFT